MELEDLIQNHYTVSMVFAMGAFDGGAFTLGADFIQVNVR